MSKRRAEEPLEDYVAVNSPASKRARVSDSLDESSFTNGTNSPVTTPKEQTNGLENEDRDKDTLGKPSEDLQPNEDVSALTSHARQDAPLEGYTDLYLDTINRAVLDFDFEKLCSISLSNINVYACLICGKYYQGRGPKSHAYFHALDVDHHVYINMETKKVYVLPEGYEVTSKSLEDIKFVVDPRLSKEDVLKLDKESRDTWDLAGKRYRPGFIGMNNIKDNDYLNVIVQTMAHIPPIRNFFMLEDFHNKPELAQRFSTLVRKIWNVKAFKSHVSPHELLQEIALRSSKRFTLTQQSDPVDFLSWFLNNLHLAVGGSKTKAGSSIIQKAFQGKLRIESQQITAKADAGDRLRFEEAAEVNMEISRYLMLTLDLPPAPLFQDELDKNIIPQVPLTSILSKYDGVRAQEHLNYRRRYRLLHPLPPFLLFHIKRFSSNKFVSERNPTIVTFSAGTSSSSGSGGGRSLDMSAFVEPAPSLHPVGEPIWYDLVANVTHEAVRVGGSSGGGGSRAGGDNDGVMDAGGGAGVVGEAKAIGGGSGSGSGEKGRGGGGGGGGGKGGGAGGARTKKVWRVQVRDRARGDEWLEIQDLWVEQANAETLFTKESYLQVWERRKDGKKGGAVKRGKI